MNGGLLFRKITLFAVAMVCLYAAFSLLYVAIDAADRQMGKDFVSAFEERAQVVLPFLKNETSIGYFFATDYETAAGRNFTQPPGYATGEAAENSARQSLMNYALRPKGAFLNWERETDLLIADFQRVSGKPPARIRIRNADYDLVQDFNNGMSLYRRQR